MFQRNYTTAAVVLVLLVILHQPSRSSGGNCENSKLIQRFSNALPIAGKFVLPVSPTSAGFHKIIVKGQFRGLTKFHINLLTGPSYDNDDVALHLRVDGANQNLHASTRKNGNWYQAINKPRHIQTDSKFEIVIEITRNHYRVYMNNVLEANYVTNIFPSEITYVYLNNDNVQIDSVEREFPDVSAIYGVL